MDDQPFAISGEILQKIHQHIARTGEPLLRRARPTDAVTLVAWPDHDGGFDLVLDDDDAMMASIDTWQGMADFFGMELQELCRHLSERGYPGELPVAAENEVADEDEMADEDETDDEDDMDDEGGFLADPYYVREFLLDLLPEPSVYSVLAGVRGKFIWDEATAYPGVPANVEDALVWLGEPLGGLESIHEVDVGRPGYSDTVIWAPSPTALSCLQHVLDALNRNVWIRVEDQ